MFFWSWIKLFFFFCKAMPCIQVTWANKFPFLLIPLLIRVQYHTIKYKHLQANHNLKKIHEEENVLWGQTYFPSSNSFLVSHPPTLIISEDTLDHPILFLGIGKYTHNSAVVLFSSLSRPSSLDTPEGQSQTWHEFRRSFSLARRSWLPGNSLVALKIWIYHTDTKGAYLE